MKNVVGFWILEQCRIAWGDPPIESLIAEAAHIDGPIPRFDASDHRFVSPEDMLGEVTEAAGLEPDASRAIIVRSVLESIVDGVVGVVDEIEAAVGAKPGRLALVGGGSRIPLLAELLASRSGMDVVVGSPEATALGNAVVQGIAIGHFDDLAQAQNWLAVGSLTTGGGR